MSTVSFFSTFISPSGSAATMSSDSTWENSLVLSTNGITFQSTDVRNTDVSTITSAQNPPTTTFTAQTTITLDTATATRGDSTIASFVISSPSTSRSSASTDSASSLADTTTTGSPSSTSNSSLTTSATLADASPSQTKTGVSPIAAPVSNSNQNAVYIAVPIAAFLFIIGAAFSLVVYWARRKRRESRNPEAAVATEREPKQPPPYTAAADGDTCGLISSPFSPTPIVFPNTESPRSVAELKELFTEPVAGLFDHVDAHIARYYKSPAQESSLAPLANQQKSATSLLQTPHLSPTALHNPSINIFRHALAYALVFRITFNTDPLTTTTSAVPFRILPLELTSNYTSTSPGKRRAHLQQFKDANPNFIAEQETRAKTLAMHIASSLQPWALEDELAPKTREEDLKGLIMYAQGLGLRIFESREELGWDWQEVKSGMIVVRPAFVVYKEDGRRMLRGYSRARGKDEQEVVVPAHVEKI